MICTKYPKIMLKKVTSITVFSLSLMLASSAMANNSSSDSGFNILGLVSQLTQTQSNNGSSTADNQKQLMYSMARQFVNKEKIQSMLNAKPQNSKAMLMCMASNNKVLQANKGLKKVLKNKLANVSEAELNQYLMQAIQNGSIVPVIRGLGLSVVAEDGTIFNQNNQQLLQSVMSFSMAVNQCAGQTNFSMSQK